MHTRSKPRAETPCLFLTRLNKDIRTIICEQLFADRHYSICYDFDSRHYLWPRQRSTHREIGQSCVGVEHPSSHHILLTCRTVYLESRHPYYANMSVTFRGNSVHSYLSNRLVRQLCPDLTVERFGLNCNYRQFHRLKTIKIEDRDMVLAKIWEGTSFNADEDVDDKLLLSELRAQCSQCLSNAQDIELLSGAKVVLQARVVAFKTYNGFDWEERLEVVSHVIPRTRIS